MIPIDQITALILAGGRGTRMGQVDKGLQLVRGKPMVAHVLRSLEQQAGAVAINANQNLAAYERYGVPVWPDERPDFQGPLAGLETGLRRCTTALLATAPCDSPCLPTDLVARLSHALYEAGADLAMAETLEADTDGTMRVQPHPVFALMKATVLPQVSAYLAAGGRRMDGWTDAITVVHVRFDDTSAFRNINTLQELQQFDTMTVPHLAHITSTLPAYDPNELQVRDAQRIIKDFVTPVDGIEQLPLLSVLDRVLAQDIISPISVPAHDNSAMDGYALRGADLPTQGQTTLAVIGTVYAGRPSDATPLPGQCVRIMTGGVMPASCDSVIPQELVAAIGEHHITINAAAIGAGDNRRFAGEDLMAGSAALKAGRRLRPSDLGLLASLGIASVPVRRRLRVAFFSTGDELRALGQPLDAGCVYDSNRYSLFGMLTRLGCEVIDMGIVRDDPQALEDVLRSACAQADAIVTSGGVSVGAADYSHQIMGKLGDVRFWKIAMRPGRPLAFGRVAADGHSAYLFGLPGNPVAVMVSFYFFARTALLQMIGTQAPQLLIKVRSQGAIRKKPGRTEYQRGIVAPGPDGAQQVSITGAQGSGILRSMSEANCMVVLHAELGNVAAGDMVDVLLFDGLL